MIGSVSTLIIKPTKACNADCTYCSAPPDGAPKWDIPTFEKVFEALKPRLNPRVMFIWHGGEPMLLGTEFYNQAYKLVKKDLPQARFSLQSNMLSYNEDWNKTFQNVFEGRLSTSWDPDEIMRTYKGKAELYSRIYHARMKTILNDGWRPKIISTFDETTIHLAANVYDLAFQSAQTGQAYDIRLNYRYPAGRADGWGATLTAKSYGDALVKIYNKWIADCPPFAITPLDQMFLKVTGVELARCPWAKGCTGKILGIEPNFDVYNCGEFADLADDQYRFGNLLTDGIEACLTSHAANKLRKRTIKHPESCKACAHYEECEAGCMRDSTLYGRGIDGKFFYCESWQTVFSRIKQSIMQGEADNLIRSYGQNPDSVRHQTVQRALLAQKNKRINMRESVPAWNIFKDIGQHTDANGKDIGTLEPQHENTRRSDHGHTG